VVTSRRAVSLRREIYILFMTCFRARRETGTSGGGCLPQMSFTARRRRGACVSTRSSRDNDGAGNAVLERLKGHVGGVRDTRKMEKPFSMRV